MKSIEQMTEELTTALAEKISERRHLLKELNDADLTVQEFKHHLEEALAENQRKEERIRELEGSAIILNEIVTKVSEQNTRLQTALENVSTWAKMALTDPNVGDDVAVGFEQIRDEADNALALPPIRTKPSTDGEKLIEEFFPRRSPNGFLDLPERVQRARDMGL